MEWHEAFKDGEAKAGMYKTEIDAAITHGYTLETWHTLNRETRAMLTAKLLIDRAFQVLQSHKTQRQRKANK